MGSINFDNIEDLTVLCLLTSNEESLCKFFMAAPNSKWDKWLMLPLIQLNDSTILAYIQKFGSS